MKNALLVGLVVMLAHTVAATDGIKQQDQIYIISGVFGGLCLLLTITTIVNSLSITRLQEKVARLQTTNTAVSKTMAEVPRSQHPRGDEFNRYSAQDDPYRPTPARENYRMERPTPPPRIHRGGPSGRDNYY